MNNFILDIETTGFEPVKLRDRILCITIRNINSETPITFYGEDEKKILSQFWNAVKSCEKIYTFNGDEFDIPFIMSRSLINNIKINNNIKYIDLRKIVNSFYISYKRYCKGNLRDWAELLGLSISTQDGSKMKELYEKKDWKEITKHSEEDVFITHFLYKRCINCGVIKDE